MWKVLLAFGGAAVGLLVLLAVTSSGDGGGKATAPVGELPATSGGAALAPVTLPARNPVDVEAAAAEPPEDERPVAHEQAEAPRALRVLVLDPQRIAVSAARVELYRRPWARARASVAADASGVAVVTGARAGDELVARAAGYPETRLTLSAPPWPEPLSVHLRAGALLVAGEVVDEHSAPVEGALVSLYDGVRTLRARTADGGRFELTGEANEPVPHEVVLDVETEGFWFPAAGESVPLELFRVEGGRVRLPVLRWASLTVVVRDGGGEPVEGAELDLRLGPDEGERHAIPGYHAVALRGVVTSDRPEHATGRHTLDVPPELELWLNVRHPDLEPATVRVGALRPAEERELPITLRGTAGSGLARFAVVDPAGAPVAPGRYSVSFGSYISFGDLADDGTFSFGRPAVDWEVTISAPGYTPLRRTFVTGEPVEGVITVEVAPSDVGISVRVVDPDGSPRSGLPIDVRNRARTFQRPGITDAGGWFRVLGLEEGVAYDVDLGWGSGVPGTYSEDSSKVPSPAAFRGVRASSRPLVFRLVEPAALRGRFDGELPASARMCLSLYLDPRDRGRPVFTVNAPFDADGTFAFADLPPGHYRVWSYEIGSGDLDAPLTTFELAEGERREDLIVAP